MPPEGCGPLRLYRGHNPGISIHEAYLFQQLHLSPAPPRPSLERATGPLDELTSYAFLSKSPNSLYILSKYLSKVSSPPIKRSTKEALLTLSYLRYLSSPSSLTLTISCMLEVSSLSTLPPAT